MGVMVDRSPGLVQLRLLWHSGPLQSATRGHRTGPPGSSLPAGTSPHPPSGPGPPSSGSRPSPWHLILLLQSHRGPSKPSAASGLSAWSSPRQFSPPGPPPPTPPPHPHSIHPLRGEGCMLRVYFFLDPQRNRIIFRFAYLNVGCLTCFPSPPPQEIHTPVRQVQHTSLIPTAVPGKGHLDGLIRRTNE